MPGRLNSFQKSMLQWNDLHAYNAVHVARIPAALDFERLRGVITTTLEGHGLTGLSYNRSAGTYQYAGGPALVEVKLCPMGESWSMGYARETERQLNMPFAPSERFTPFRFFVVPEEDSFSLGLVYFHPIADAESILHLLKELVETYRGIVEPGHGGALDLYPPGEGRRLRLHPGALARKLAALPSFIRNLRKSSRPPFRDPGDLANRFTLFSLGPSDLRDLIQGAKSLGVSLNDLFLARLLKGVATLIPDRTRAVRRRGISLGCIVNVRRDLGLSGQRVFGLFLGSFVVHHEVPANLELAEVARDIGLQTRAIKQGRLYLGTALELALGRLMISWSSVARRNNFYPKHYPLWGGLTNMNLNPLWPQSPDHPSIDYFRAVSTGPATPLVFSITTLGQVAHIGVSYRSTVFSEPEIERLKAGFLEPLGSLAGPL